jgi:NAD(P)-dependent dehydrogenase (short-subunit alcohol dehydrogenase family)
VEAEGRVDVLINNAAFNVTGILEVVDPEVSRLNITLNHP